ncbi:MAG: hypothetical protein HYY41_04475, partial [Chloroflexi bacterium]|nr:hypothetical protein [Chloroflexota bacterium]
YLGTSATGVVGVVGVIGVAGAVGVVGAVGMVGAAGVVGAAGAQDASTGDSTMRQLTINQMIFPFIFFPSF